MQAGGRCIKGGVAPCPLPARPLFSFPHVLPSRHLPPSLLLILNTIQLDAEDHHVAAMAVNHHQIRSFRPRHSPTGTSTPQWEVVSLLRVRSIFGLVARPCSPRWTVEEWTKGHGVRLRVAGFVAERCTHTGMATVFDRQCSTNCAGTCVPAATVTEQG